MIKARIFLAKSPKFIWIIGLFCTLLITGIYAATLSFQTMPAAEGWYTYYAQLINEGEVVYRDFSYLFFPFYIQLIALFTRIFGYSILALRIFGIVLFMGIGATSYTIFSKLTTPQGATIAGIATTLYLQSEVVQIFYDYIRVMDLCAYLAVLFLIDYTIAIAKESSAKIDYRVILSAVFASLACMTKQSTGALLLVYSVVFLLFLVLVLDRNKTLRLVTNVGVYLATVTIAFGLMLLWLWSKGALNDFFYNTTGNAVNAKGGVLTVLFRWWGQEINNLFAQLWPTALIFGGLGVLRWLSKFAVFQKRTTNYAAPVVLICLSTVLTLSGLILCRYFESTAAFFNQHYPGTAKSLGFTFCTICFFSIGIYLLYWAAAKGKFSKKKESDSEIQLFLPWFALLGAIFAIAYGVGISGGLAESQVALSIGFLIVLVSKTLEKFRYENAGMVGLIVIASFLTITFGARKYVTPYSWWGLNEGNIQEATYVSKVPLLKGIKMKKADQVMYDGVVEIIEESSEPNDTIFCFPHIPIFYSLSARQSITYTKVQWFDMSSKTDILADMEALENNPPKVIVVCELPEFVSEGHESSFNSGRISQTRIMAQFLQDFTDQNGYAQRGAFPICDGYAVNVYVKTESDQPIEHLDYKQYLDPNYDEYMKLVRIYSLDFENGWLLSSTNAFADLGESLGIPKEHYNDNIKNSEMLQKILQKAKGDLLIETKLYYNYLEEKGETAGDTLANYQCVAVTDAVAILKQGVNDLQLTNRVLGWNEVYGIYPLEPLFGGAGVKDPNGIFLDRGLGAAGSFNWWQKNAQVQIDNYGTSPLKATVSFDIYTNLMNTSTGDTIDLCLGDQTATVLLNDANEEGIVHADFECTLQPGGNRLFIKANTQQVTSQTDSRKMYVMVANFSVDPVR